jgi:simple sugar transport system ATP-binding protein
MVRQLRSEGAGIVIITHKMREVRDIADRLTVLRGGRVILSDVVAAEVSDHELVTAMIGEAVRPAQNARPQVVERVTPLLEAKGLRLTGVGEGSGLRGVDLAVGAGEVLGIAGVAGNGQRELADLLTGAARPDGGQVTIAGSRMPEGNPRSFRQAGVVSVAADPLREFVVPGLTIAEHAALWEASGGRGRRFDSRGAGKRLAAAGQRLELSLATPNRRLDRLSGGNIQRVLLALALGEPCQVLVVSYPTRGLDVRTTEKTRSLLLAARDAGSAVVLISEDLDELMTLSDRILVLAHGRASGTVGGATADRRELGRLMTATPDALSGAAVGSAAPVGPAEAPGELTPEVAVP